MKTKKATKKPPQEPVKLCFRCEWRAKFHESGIRPRYECGDISRASYSCYMFKPIKPLILKPIKGERRPILGPLFIAGRMEGFETPDLQISAKKVKKGILIYWLPEKEKQS